MSYRPGDTFRASFATHDPASGAAANADSTPAATLRRNGTDSAEAVTVTNNATGDYTASGVIPAAWSPDDELELVVAATVDAVAAKTVIGLGRLGDRLRIRAAVAATDSASSFTASDDLAAEASAYEHMLLVFTGGANAGGPPRRVTSYTAGRVITVDAAFPFTIAADDPFVLIGYAG